MKNIAVGIVGEVTYGKTRKRKRREPQPKPREKCPIHDSQDTDSIDEESMNQQEEDRAETEKRRLRRLMIQGIVKPEEIEDSALYNERRNSRTSDRSARATERTQSSKYRRKSGSAGVKSNRRKSPRRPTTGTTPAWTALKPSFSPPPRPMTTPHTNCQVTFASDDDSDSEEVILRPSRSSNRIHSSTSRVDSPIETEVSRVSLTEDLQDYKPKKYSRPATAPSRGRQAPDVNGRARSATSRLARRYKHPLVRDMEDEQSVEGLYRIADKLIIKGPSDRHTQHRDLQ